MYKVGIIGCGLIGQKRAKALPNFVKISKCFDLNHSLNLNFAKQFNCEPVNSVYKIFNDQEINILIIATTHDTLSELALAGLQAGKHIFVEKPGGHNNISLFKIKNFYMQNNIPKLHIGYNHRFHPSIQHAFNLFKSGEIGQIMFMRGRYGHGGRLGYEKEWRANKQVSGGGELIDQGSHLLDLSLLFLGDIKLDYASTPTYYWNMEVEDNAFFSVKNEKGNIGFFHASCTEWKNMFSLEIYGETGKLEIQGLGGSYGMERIIFHKMLPEMGPPLTEIWEFPGEDISWKLEVEQFISDIQNNTNESSNLESSLLILDLISEIYERTGR